VAELFPGPGVRITHEFVETLTGVPRSYPIRDLYQPHVIHESIVDVALSSPTARVCSGAVTGLSALVAATGTQLLHSPHATVVATIMAVGAAVAAVRGWRQWRRPRGLWVYYRGQPLCVFVTRDRLLFGQVTRALLRAFEGEAY
jgi:Family of unknown function (DUF6232)